MLSSSCSAGACAEGKEHVAWLWRGFTIHRGPLTEDLVHYAAFSVFLSVFLWDAVACYVCLILQR